MAKKADCLTPECVRRAETRGLCGPCYTAARDSVKRGEATWKELEDMGLASPKTKGESSWRKWLQTSKKKKKDRH